MSNNQRRQKIFVFQQNGSGKAKIQGILKYGNGLFLLEIISIDEVLPPVMDDTSGYLPHDIHADLVLDFLKHAELSYDLSMMCNGKEIPVVAPGKKMGAKGVFTPPT